MSKVIKGIVWSDDPRVISVPKNQDDVSGNMERMSDTAYQDMLMNLMEREKRAEKMLRDAKIQCEIIKAEALQQAQMQGRQEAEALKAETLQQAQAEAEELRRTTYESAYNEGYNKGQQDGQQQIIEEQKYIIENANQKAEKTLANARDEVTKYIAEGEYTVAEMVLQIADKVISQHFIDVPLVILPLVREAIQKVKDQPFITVRVCSEAYEFVLPARAELQSMLEGNAKLDVISDASLKPGDCVLESPNGTVDARLNTQMEQIRLAVCNMMN